MLSTVNCSGRLWTMRGGMGSGDGGMGWGGCGGYLRVNYKYGRCRAAAFRYLHVVESSDAVRWTKRSAAVLRSATEGAGQCDRTVLTRRYSAEDVCQRTFTRPQTDAVVHRDPSTKFNIVRMHAGNRTRKTKKNRSRRKYNIMHRYYIINKYCVCVRCCWCP